MITFVSLISGSSGNSTLISDGHTNLLVDCGMSGTKLKQSLNSIGLAPESIDALLITHEHIDHTKGAGVISRRYNIPVYATEGTHIGLSSAKIPDKNIYVISENTDFEIGSIAACAFEIPHDARQPVGYTFFAGGEKCAVATDIGKMNMNILNNVKGSKYVLLESNHDVEMLQYGPYPYPLKRRIMSDIGHLSNETAAKSALWLVNHGTEHIMLGHLSDKNNRPEIAMLESYNILTEAGINIGSDITLKVADRHTPTSC